MREVIKLGLILLIITSIAAFVLGITNNITQGVIEARLEAENIKSIEALLPDADDFKKVEGVEGGIIVEVYEGFANGNVVGYTIKTTPNGYNGTVEVLVGVTKAGEIVGVKIGQNTETPGLGTKIADASHTNQYLGKDITAEFVVTKDNPTADKQIQAVTSATVSSNAVISGVNSAGSLFNDKLKNR